MTLQKRFFILFFSSFITGLAQAQTTEAYYDIRWETCPKEGASYYSNIKKTDSGYYRTDYFLNNGKLQMAALYEDEKCEKLNGSANWFYADGSLSKSARYVHGKPDGLYLSFYPNSFMSDSANYKNGTLVGTSLQWHPNGFLKDSIAPIGDSNFVCISWFDDGQPYSAGRQHNDQPYGVWVYYHPNGTKADVANFVNGKAVSHQFYDDQGNKVAFDSARLETPATIKGGVKTWTIYLQNKLLWPEPYHFNGVKKVVTGVEMTIDEKGNITQVYVTNPFHPAFDKLAYDIISKGPKWSPAIQNNRPVKYRFLQVLTFQDAD